MAPRNKYTKEEMLNAALRVVQAGGIAALTAKALADELKTSTQPVFTCFGTMDALKAEVVAAAQDRFDAYVQEGLRDPVPFFGYGKQYIRFAKEEPELYRLLFLTPNADGTSGAMDSMMRCRESVCPSIEKIYHMTPEEAERYYRNTWLIGHSLATLIVSGGCPFGEWELEQILTEISVSTCKAIKEIPGFVEGTFDRNAVFSALVNGKSGT